MAIGDEDAYDSMYPRTFQEDGNSFVKLPIHPLCWKDASSLSGGFGPGKIERARRHESPPPSG